MPDEAPVINEKSLKLDLSNPVDAMQIGRFYANHASVNISLFEIRLIMSFVNGVNPDNQAHLLALESMILSMSPELAYATHALLGRAIENYTRSYGPIRKMDPTLKLKDRQADPAVRAAMDMDLTPEPETKE
jgi:hypothetical protein